MKGFSDLNAKHAVWVLYHRYIVSMINLSLFFFQENLYFEPLWFVYFHKRSESHNFGQFFAWNWRKWGLSIFNDNDLLLNNLFIFMIFLFMALVNSMGSDFVIIILVSSAKRTGLAEIVIVFGISFICNIKNKVPRLESWGTPYLIGSHTRIIFGYGLDRKHGQGKRFFWNWTRIVSTVINP